MRILVIGANGGIGRQVLEQALKAGHEVTALLRTPAKLNFSHPALTIVRGDILLPGCLEKSLAGSDAVIAAVGGKMTKPTELFSKGSLNLIQAMEREGVRRAFFISSSAIEISPVLPLVFRLLEKYVLQKLLKEGYADQRKMEKNIKESDLNWTIIRPPRLTDKPVTGNYRYASNRFLKNAFNISRADVAHFMLQHLEDEETFGAVVELGY